MKLIEYRSSFLEKITKIYDVNEAESFFYLILEHRLGLKRVDLALNRDIPITPEEQRYWQAAIEQLEKFVPIQYIIGVAHFFGLEFEVNSAVLIPRPETEELVQWILTNHKSQSSLKILDLCTGSGCIAIALAKNLPNAEVTALDISGDALEVAARNASSNSVVVNFIEQDLLSLQQLDQKYDLIVSNPPYVRLLEKESMESNVLEYEPHLALFVPDADALLFYRKISDLADMALVSKGELYLEINQYLSKETIDLLEQHDFSLLELRKDIYGNHRMVFAQKM